MKTFIFVVCPIFFFSTCVSAQTYEIWGAWNPGQPSSNIYNNDTGDGIFRIDRSSYFIVLYSNFYGRGSQILYDGGNYIIKEIIGHIDNIFSLYIEELQPDFEDGWMVLNAKIIIHFINEDLMWVEIDYNDPKYPTTPGFLSRFFVGESLIYWRDRLE